MNGVSSISTKISAFPTLLKKQDSKLKPFPCKTPKIEKFFAINSPNNNFRRKKVWNKIDREPVLVFTQKTSESDQCVPRKLDLK